MEKQEEEALRELRRLELREAVIGIVAWLAFFGFIIWAANFG